LARCCWRARDRRACALTVIRKRIAVAVCLAGGLLLTFAGERYAVGLVKADRARQAWDAAAAARAVMTARIAASRSDSREPLIDGAPVARLIIPRIGLDEIVLEGVDGDDLNALPGHLPESAMPGDAGNAVISAHRDRHFRHFDALRVGDTITTESRGSRSAWVVVATRIVDKNAPALFRTRDATLTLTTCWPIRYLGSAPDRLIVTAKPLSTSS